MALDFAIHNVGEYYSSHYLDTTFSKDAQKFTSSWKEAGAAASPRQLQKLAQRYFKAKAQAIEELDWNQRRNAGVEIQSWHSYLLQAIGYSDLEAMDLPVESGDVYVPILGLLQRFGQPWLVVCESVFCIPDGSLPDGAASEDPLEGKPLLEQLVDSHHKLVQGDWGRAIGEIFKTEEPPRWVMILAGSRILLIDRKTYANGRWLAFDLDEAFGRNEKTTFEQIATFLSRETLAPDSESVELLHDTLGEQSHKLAHGVTENLQVAVREAIELLANEWVSDRRRRSLGMINLRPEEALPDGSTTVTAEQLRHEALTFVYRLIFCFYAEAHGAELGVLPINDDAYRLGYSLEALRDLELVPLSEQSAEGTYFQTHLNRLFTLVHEGFHPLQQEENPDQLQLQLAQQQRTFELPPLTATLFDPKATPLLSRAQLSNRCLQKVIRLLSLSYDEKTKTTGRVNYADLGINQLGAVYEGLLSYKGEFIKQDSIQVKRAQDEFNKSKTQTWFVPKDRLEEFKKDEVERLSTGQHKPYPKGTFILHLSGLDREQSASYYTPEVLTKCLVEETLRPLLQDYTPEDADKILQLTVCEPAMGSGAFLNEAANQLAQKYLELKQKQLNQSIEHADFPDELRRVRHYITTRNLYGVDLNPTAVELGALSLWLNSMHRAKLTHEDGAEEWVRGATPWFGLRLRAGNSLIGARRAVWTKAQLLAGVHLKSGNEAVEPRQLQPGEQRGKNEVYHYLVFDPDMVPTAGDALVKQFHPQQVQQAKEWLRKEAKSKWTEAEVNLALAVSDLVDQHEQQYAKERLAALEKTACPGSVWPQPPATEPGPSLALQEEVKAKLESTSGSFQRLKLLMDSWCALFFWSMDEVEALPRREDYLEAAQILLARSGDLSIKAFRWNFDGANLLKATAQTDLDTDLLCAAVSWYRVSRDVAEQERFQHWELAFSEVLGCDASQSKGFDVILGNPPWLKVSWADAALLCDFNAILGVREARSAEFNKARPQLLKDELNRSIYLDAQKSSLGTVAFLNCHRIYEALRGSQTNLYKNFLVKSWALLGKNGFGGLLHQEGTYDDANGGRLRSVYYRRLLAHYHFKNELPLFQDVGHQSSFSLNVFGNEKEEVNFTHLANLYVPNTVASCRNHKNPEDLVPGIKTDDDKWETKGHCERIVQVTEKTLEIFHSLLEDSTVQIIETRLPQVHARQLVTVIEKISQSPKYFTELDGKYFATELFHETNSQRDGILTRQDNPSFEPQNTNDWVISGPHFYVGTPLNKTPRTICNSKGAYDDIDLTEISENYLPRAVYRPGNQKGERSVFNKAIPEWCDKSIISYYRYVNRQLVSLSTERTLISAIIPKNTTHIFTAVGISFKDAISLLGFASSTFSIIFDFLIRASGRGHVLASDLKSLPKISDPHITPIMHRGLRLNAVTKHYADLWTSVALTEITQDNWAVENPMLDSFESPWHELDPQQWSWHSPLRSDYSRRQALLEIDVLVALALGLSLDELTTIYCVQFPVMRQYELGDEYDAKGQRLPSTNRKAPGGKEVREARKDWNGTSPLTVSWQINDGLETVTKTFYPPFTKVDRETDYAQAYEVLQKRYGGGV
ncbi:DNA methyltransferase [Nostoc sp. FACHB-145]|uniref:DNA methyltransferase n=1 Tax=Nostoc sp. FACHB-145 TaxID=2692836 RepID=UPI00168398DD|nr:DNA methyltransferase [Nostoc sp. FACHB-145]MBD2466314.1 hypothetical protein [Nostoc sp. FACHB-145]